MFDFLTISVPLWEVILIILLVILLINIDNFYKKIKVFIQVENLVSDITQLTIKVKEENIKMLKLLTDAGKHIEEQDKVIQMQKDLINLLDSREK